MTTLTQDLMNKEIEEIDEWMEVDRKPQWIQEVQQHRQDESLRKHECSVVGNLDSLRGVLTTRPN